MEAAAQPDGVRPWYSRVLPPLVALAGILLLLFFGGENWVYTLPGFEPDTRMIFVDGNPLHGQIQLPVAAKTGGHVKVTGWFGESAAAFQSQKIVLYVDNRTMAETAMTESTLPGANGGSTLVKNWRADFLMTDIAPGDHILTVQSIPQGREPVSVSQSDLSVAR